MEYVTDDRQTYEQTNRQTDTWTYEHTLKSKEAKQDCRLIERLKINKIVNFKKDQLLYQVKRQTWSRLEHRERKAVQMYSEEKMRK